ncbi:hypothetical protein BDM02DRAFT_1269101 [Thelephora ganbajun]|uniref:Uncharacterized protein n=1 Tax=Thelephora ganbajun TaxID=370292 RepID=A0ACB6Z372_THEGA|nr:hypothetical protein BDM02DRAFT_1269101 [Thelephora ganbajun]
MRSKGNPRKLVADFNPYAGIFWAPSTFACFSRILKIQVLPSLDVLYSPISLQNPVPLQLLTDAPLRILGLYNVVLPWVLNYVTGLKELPSNLNIAVPVWPCWRTSCSGSLMRIGVRKDQQLPYKHVLQPPRLTSLLLLNNPEVIRYILTHIHIPAIAPLDIFAHISDGDGAQALGTLWPPNRLFQNTVQARHLTWYRSKRYHGLHYTGLVICNCFPGGLVEAESMAVEGNFPT